MKTHDAGQSISDLPLDLFGGVDVPAPTVVEHEQPEPGIYCWRCQALLTVGLSTCPQCAAQNTVVPVINSAPPVVVDEMSPRSGTYVGRVAFALTYMLRDIVRRTMRIAGETGHALLELILHGPHNRNPRR